MSPAQLLKRALVTILLELARVYALDLGLSRDSPDPNVKKAFRRVILRAHPDKAGGSEAASKKLTAAWSQWLEAGRSKGKPGRTKNTSATGALVPNVLCLSDVGPTGVCCACVQSILYILGN